ncbi:MAG: hypothetical protein ACFCUT_12210 [Kiloniellaceae bacterium]
MSDIFATLAAGVVRSSGAQSTAGSDATVRVVEPSPDLQRLVSGENLRGTVVGKDDHGHLLVRTRLGVLTLSAPRTLPVGTEVILQVRSVGPQVIFNLLPLATAAGGSAVQPGQVPSVPAGVPAAPVHPPNPSDPVQRGQLLRAVLHAAPPAPSLAGLPTAQPGTELLARVLSVGVQSPALAAATGPLTAGLPGAAAPAPGAPGASPGNSTGNVPGSLPGQGSGAGTAALTGTPVTPGSGSPGGLATGGAVGNPAAPQATPPTGPAAVAPQMPPPALSEAAPGFRLAPQMPVANTGHTLATALQSLTSEAAGRLAGGNLAGGGATATQAAGGNGAAADGAANLLRVTGLVTAISSGGQPILHTPLGTLTLDTRAALPPGTSLALEIALPVTSGTTTAPVLASTWPSLGSLEEALLHGLPAGQAEAVARALPQVGPRLASGMLFFLAALNQGNIAGWLAKAGAAAGQSERAGLYETLGREFAGLSRTIETAAGEWRFVSLPLWSDQGLRELRCYFRHQEHGGRQGEDGEKATRFVLELELKRHGELQLDGLVRPQLFDLVLRSRRPLPALVRGDLLALFEETNAIAGYNGRLVFRASGDWPQLIAARAATAPHEGLNV